MPSSDHTTDHGILRRAGLVGGSVVAGSALVLLGMAGPASANPVAGCPPPPTCSLPDVVLNCLPPGGTQVVATFPVPDGADAGAPAAGTGTGTTTSPAGSVAPPLTNAGPQATDAGSVPPPAAETIAGSPPGTGTTPTNCPADSSPASPTQPTADQASSDPAAAGASTADHSADTSASPRTQSGPRVSHARATAEVSAGSSAKAKAHYLLNAASVLLPSPSLTTVADLGPLSGSLEPSPDLAALSARLNDVQPPLLAAAEQRSNVTVLQAFRGKALPGLLIVLATVAVALVGAGHLWFWQTRLAGDAAGCLRGLKALSGRAATRLSSRALDLVGAVPWRPGSGIVRSIRAR